MNLLQNFHLVVIEFLYRTSYNPAISIKSLEETDESIAVNSYQFNSLLITNMPKFSQVFVVVYFQLHL